MLIAEIEVPPFLPILLRSELILVHQCTMRTINLK